MLTDRFPDLQKLDAQEKLLLAGELWFDATHSGSGSPAPDLPAELVEKIEKRLDTYLADPSDGIEWDELKRRMLDAKDH